MPQLAVDKKQTLPVNDSYLSRSTSCQWITRFSHVVEKGMDSHRYGKVQYIPRNMHTVFALLCFVVVIHWLIFPYPSGLLHWHCGNLTIAPVPAKQPWWIWINTSCEFIMNDCITTTKQSTTKPCAYFLGYTVFHPLTEINRIMAWISNPIRHAVYVVIIHPCPNFNDGFAKPPLKLRLGWAIASHCFVWM